MKKIKLLCLSLLVLVLQSCQTSETFVQPKPSIDKVLASNESKLVKGLSLLQGKIPKNGRVQKSQVDALLLDSALKLVNRKTGSTNYSLLLSRDLPYSITNLVISEKKGSYLGFVVQYVNANPDGGWNLDKFSGKIIVRSVDGTKEATMDVNPATNSKGRTEASICTTTVTKITVSSAYGSNSYYEAEYGCLFIEWNDLGNLGDQPYEAQPDEIPVSETGGDNSEEEETPSQNKLCGSYIFTETGEGLTAEIISLSAPAIHRPSGQHIPHLWGSACLTFGSSTGLTNSKDASEAFNQAWGVTTDEVEVWLNKDPKAPLSVVYSDFFKVTLIANLKSITKGAIWFSTGPCDMTGTVPSLAQYCN